MKPIQEVEEVETQFHSKKKFSLLPVSSHENFNLVYLSVCDSKA